MTTVLGNLRPRGLLWLALAIAALSPIGGCSRTAGGAPLPPAQAVSAFDTQIRPILVRYCIDCHRGPHPKGDLDLARFQGTVDLAQQRQVWEDVLDNLRSHAMPPEGKPSPTSQERERLTRWIDAELTRLDAAGGRDPGRVTMRRLNRSEYNNTVRDLLGIQLKPADDFPTDDVGYGFDNIGDVLSLPTILLEKYLAAADKIATATIITEETHKPAVQRLLAEKFDCTIKAYPIDGTSRVLVTNGELFIDYDFPSDGDYVFAISAYADQAGSEPAKMALRLGTREVQAFDVTAESPSAAVYRARAHVMAGHKRLAVAFLNDFYQPDAPANRRDRNLVVEFVEVRGPVNLGAIALPESHRNFFTCRSGHVHDDACARQTLRRFSTRAFRRPVREDELERLLALVRQARSGGCTFERAMQLAVQAVLVSPHFLYRVELDPPGDGRSHRLSGYELASRLSYFLWSSMPDDKLLEQARTGALDTPEKLLAEMRRMLADPKSRALVENFGGQWLQTRNLHVVTPDPEKFPAFDDELRAAMQTETEMFFQAVVTEDRSILDFLDADFTFLNERLARHYDFSGIKGPEFRRVKLNGGLRGGVIAQASMLTVTSNPTRTSPVKRGKWILENILGIPPPPPPPVVAELNEEEQVVLSGTLRQRMEQHRTDPNCASCHQRMDPLGFGLENFNGIGAWRKQDGKFPIDATGTLPDGSAFDGPRELKKLLKSRSDDFAHCLAEKMLTYAIGRGLEASDRYAVQQIATALANDGYKFSRLLAEVVASEPFQMRRGAPVDRAPGKQDSQQPSKP